LIGLTVQIDASSIPGPFVSDYEAIPIAFEVTSVLDARRRPGSSRFTLTESAIAPSYVKDYDAISDRPTDWANRFDTSQWVLLLARTNVQPAGGAAVAVRTPQLDMLEGRNDLAVLWDIRVAPPLRVQGVGRALFQAAEAWAHAHGCRELKVETQNVNVAACRFYAAMGCELRAVREHAYPSCPGEAQFLWYKALRVSADPLTEETRPRA
jgi:GNAT superfamily N-acetyltransferase